MESCRLKFGERGDLHTLHGFIQQRENNTTFPIREIAVRLHHRLVSIHPFPNGNGRFSRLFADLYLLQHNEPRFSWGSNNLTQDSSFRDRYLQSLRMADCSDYKELIAFADS